MAQDLLVVALWLGLNVWQPNKLGPERWFSGLEIKRWFSGPSMLRHSSQKM